jgi:DNA-binding CsgD family transcriptional regulator
MKLLAEGNLYKEIADQLEISINTLKAHCYNIYQKLHVNNKTEAIIKVFGRN